jgi:Ca2+-binding RTX toxin-like protein
MTQSKNVLTKLTMSGLLLMAACGGESATNKPRSYTFDATGFDGLDSQEMPLVTTACTFVAATTTPVAPAYMQLTVGAGETLYVFKRATDGRVVANATTDGTATGPECATTTTTQIRILGTGQDHKVFLDYANGYFSMGTSLTVDTALQVRLGGVAGTTTDTVTMRGTGSADFWNFGTIGAAATSQSAANLNFGTGAGQDKFADITFGPAGATPVSNIRLLDPLDVKVSVGGGNDVITGQNAGLAAATTGFVVPLTIWGGDGDDNISNGATLGTSLFNTLNGGAGNDTFVQVGKVADHIVGGTETDLVDYSSRTVALDITLGGGTADGESGENDTLDGTIENVTGGTGNDIINAVLATTVTHVLRGGPIVSPATTDVSAGNDTLTGSNLVDILWGGAGDDILAGGTGDDTINGGPGSDTISYADRTSGIVNCSLLATCGILTESDVFNTVSMMPDIENIRGGDGADNLTGNTAANIIWGGVGADTINGGDGSDTIYGQAGNDIIHGDNDDDIIAGGDGTDTLAGDAGNDLVDATEETTAAADTAVTCGSENDVVLFDSADIAAGTLDPMATCETVL